MPQQHLTPGKDPVPIVQEAGWASGPVWTGAENLAPPGFDPRTVQPVGSRYTDYTTQPWCVIMHTKIKEQNSLLRRLYLDRSCVSQTIPYQYFKDEALK